MIKSAFLGSKERIERVFSSEQVARLSGLTDLYPQVVSGDEIEGCGDALAEVEVIVSTWGMPLLSDGQLSRLPNLKLVLYAAGDVRGFAAPLIERGVTIVSAWRANALPVAEFTLAHVLLAGKAYLRNESDYRTSRNFHSCRVGPGNRGEVLALLGAGAVARTLIELMRPFDWKVIVADPYLSDDEAQRLGVAKVSMEQAFQHGFVVSNHVPNNEETKGLIHGNLLASMRMGATFINTGRGQSVLQNDFVKVFRDRIDLTAVLDVTDPEPLPPDSDLWQLPNVFVSSHIAGSSGNEVGRMAELCLDELERYLAGAPLEHVTPSRSLVP
jgi:phosphoglycerate dehydrogenase-like enzyme